MRFAPWWPALAAILSIAVVLAAGCAPEKTSQNPAAPADHPELPARPAAQPEPPAEFVGNEACRECHRKAWDDHHASRHLRSLLAGDERSLSTLGPPVGRIAGTPYAIVRQAGKLYFGMADNPRFRQPLDIGFGSGKTGITFASFVKPEGGASFLGSQGLARVRMSWFPGHRKWFPTPKDEQLGAGDAPATLDDGRSRTCLGCHVVTLPDLSLEPERRFYGVGCESCHGPGSRHVAAAGQAGARDLRIERLGQLAPQKLVALCDRCHGSIEPVKRAPGMQVTVKVAQLRPSVGLEDSACFKKSGGQISCLTCHASHTDVATGAAHYEAVCLSCHGNASNPAGPPRSIVPASGTPVRSKPCPVQPSGRCLTCHMPSRKVFPNGENPTVMTDHCIRRFRPGDNVPGLTADIGGRN